MNDTGHRPAAATHDHSAQGLHTVVVPDPGAPVAEIRLLIPYARTGRFPLPVQELLPACLATGTIRRNRQGIVEHAADIGAELSTVVTAESLLLSVSVLAECLPEAVELLAEVLLSPAYRMGELDLVRSRAQARATADGPRTRLHRALLHHRFGPGPLTATPPSTGILQAVTTDDLHALHRDAIVPHGSVLLVMADTGPDTDRLHTLLADRLTGWSGAPSGLVLPPLDHRTPPAHSLNLTDATPDPTRALVMALSPAVPSCSPSHPALHLAQLVLGGYGSSRLMERLRTRRGLVYGVSTTVRDTRAGAWLETECAGAPGTADRITRVIVDTLHELSEAGPTAAETDRARQYALGFARFGLATRAEAASAYAGFVAQGLAPDWLTTYAARLADIRRADITEAAARHLTPTKTTFATLDTPRTTTHHLDLPSHPEHPHPHPQPDHI
ncbi:M16 family metallopeptidase [Streptomyces noursei]